MSQDTPINDPQAVWQSVRREYSIMSLEEIRVRAQETHSKVRRNLTAGFALGALVLILSTIAIISIQKWSARVTAGALMALTVFVVYSAYRRMWSPGVPSDIAATGCVAFYRTELEAQHRSLQITWRLLAAIAVLSFFTTSSILAAIQAHIRIVIPAILIVIIAERRYQAFKIKRNLTALDAFERDRS